MKKVLCLFLGIFILFTCVSCMDLIPRLKPVTKPKITDKSAEVQNKTLVSPSNTQAPVATSGTTKVYQNTNYGFKLEYLSKWTLQEKDLRTDKLDYINGNITGNLFPIYIFEEGASSLTNGGNNLNIGFSAADDIENTKVLDTNFQDMWAEMTQQYSAAGFEDVKLLSNEYKILGSNSYIIFKYSCTIENKQFNFYQAMCVKEKILVTFTYTIMDLTSTSQANEKSEIFNNLLKSFQFI